MNCRKATHSIVSKYSVAAVALLAAAAFALGGCVDRSRQGAFTPAQVRDMAASFPAKRVSLICPPKQGGLSDFITRALSTYTEPAMGVNVIVQNMPGAAGATGMRFGAKSRPDGYTVTYVTVESAILKHRPDMKGTVSYENFELLARLNYGPAALTVQADSEWKTFGDFVKYAKAHPGAIKVGNSGAYSIWHLASAAAAEKLGIDVGYVPYDGAAPSVQDLLGGHIQAVVTSASEVLPFVQDRQVRVLAIFGEARDPAVPDTPTARELGYDVVVGAWGGLGVPKGTPPEIQELLIEKFKKGFDDPKFRETCKLRGVMLAWLGPGDFEKFAKSEDAMFGRVLAELPPPKEEKGLKPLSFPRTLVWIIAALFGILLIQNLFKKKAPIQQGEGIPRGHDPELQDEFQSCPRNSPKEADAPPRFGPGFPAMLVFFAALVAYILLMYFIGYVVSTALFLFAGYVMLSKKRNGASFALAAAMAVVFSIGVFYLFAILLSVPLVEGPADVLIRNIIFGGGGG